MTTLTLPLGARLVRIRTVVAVFFNVALFRVFAGVTPAVMRAFWPDPTRTLRTSDALPVRGTVFLAERAVTFCDPAAVASVQLPLVSAREDCVIFRIDDGIAFSITRNVSGKIGYPTPVLEQAIRQPVTTRGWSTILRLVARFG